ncbi:unnamed protein product [Periconia digitata]|uniref:Aminoglycoside phosphotransferase domain-containing protein n=1 Tax=Periconia digitata TaxID=1303443 RepID=A0A9W4XG36_9PLEO|nr:unnamed protein product [Periconia digitata]
MYTKKETAMRIWGAENHSEAFEKFCDNKDYLENEDKKWEKSVSMKFPYYSSDPLPSPLPTVEEIEAARFTELELSKDLPCASHVFKIRDYAVKICSYPGPLQEAENMVFLEKNCPGLKIPKVYAAYKNQGGDFNLYLKRYPKEYPDRSTLSPTYLLVTSYADGPSCYTPVWQSLSQTARNNILRKLGEQMRLLRSVPPPNPQYYGRIHSQGFPKDDYVFLGGIQDLTTAWNGPFYSHKDFAGQIMEAGLAWACVQHGEFNGELQLLLETYEDVMSRASGQNAILYHGDLQLHNIIAIENKDDKDDPDICIIDWATMGWMPAYMETVRTLCRGKASVSMTLDHNTYLYELHKGDGQAHLETAFYLTNFLAAANISM